MFKTKSFIIGLVICVLSLVLGIEVFYGNLALEICCVASMITGAIIVAYGLLKGMKKEAVHNMHS